MTRRWLHLWGFILLTIILVSAKVTVWRGTSIMRASLSSGLPSKNVFAGVSIDTAIQLALEKIKVINPTPIQQVSIAPLCSGLSALIHAPTGSGKTLTYLLPIAKRMAANTTPLQALIIVPTRTLAIQVATDMNSLLSTQGVRCTCLGEVDQQATTYPGPVVVGTPTKVISLLKSYLQSNRHEIRNIGCIVLDEVDRMIRPPKRNQFLEERNVSVVDRLVNILSKVHGDKVPLIEKIQIIGVSATIGRTLRRDLLRSFAPSEYREGAFPFLRADRPPPMEEGSALMRAVTVPPSVEHWLVASKRNITSIASRVAVFDKMWRAHSKQFRRALIFLPSAADVESAASMLKVWNVGRITSVLEGFNSTAKSLAGAGDREVFIAPVSSARGLHIDQLDLVFIAEPPTSMDEYLHLAGRTGRISSSSAKTWSGVAATVIDRSSKRRMLGWQHALRIHFRSKSY